MPRATIERSPEELEDFSNEPSDQQGLEETHPDLMRKKVTEAKPENKKVAEVAPQKNEVSPTPQKGKEFFDLDPRVYFELVPPSAGGWDIKDDEWEEEKDPKSPDDVKTRLDGPKKAA